MYRFGYEDAQAEYLPQIEDLEYKIEKLENENSELKSKLATINQLAYRRDYNDTWQYWIWE